jgi:hypothetical protein
VHHALAVFPVYAPPSIAAAAAAASKLYQGGESSTCGAPGVAALLLDMISSCWGPLTTWSTTAGTAAAPHPAGVPCYAPPPAASAAELYQGGVTSTCGAPGVPALVLGVVQGGDAAMYPDQHNSRRIQCNHFLGAPWLICVAAQFSKNLQLLSSALVQQQRQQQPHT